MHEHIKDVTRRFAKEGYLSITFEPYDREGGVLHMPDIASVLKVANSVPDSRVMGDLDEIVAYAKRHPSGRADRDRRGRILQGWDVHSPVRCA